jgi:hypothetical protein
MGVLSIDRREHEAMAAAAETKGTSAVSGELTCPECGRTFARPQGLGAHRRQAHGVVGTSKKTARRRARTSAAATGSNGGGSRAVAAAAAPGRRRRSGGSASGRRTQLPGAGSNGDGRRLDRDALLRTIFPTGIPPREDVIAAANAWLDEAERLTRLR